MKGIAKIALGCLVCLQSAAADARTTDAVTFDAGELAPLYLYKDTAGNVLTYDLREDASGAIESAQPRYVSDAELAALRAANVEVRFISPEAKDFARGRTAGADDSPILPSVSSLPENFSIVQVNGTVYGAFFVAAEQPAGVTTHWLSYFYTSINMERFGSHMALSLLFDYKQLIDSYPPSYGPSIVGNGVVIGNVAATPNGCGFGSNLTPAYNMQVESFWNGGSLLFPQACSPDGLDDWTPYYVRITADVSGNVSYDAIGDMVWFSPIVSTASVRPPGSAGTLSGGGLLFGVVPTTNAPPIVALNFFGARSGWY